MKVQTLPTIAVSKAAPTTSVAPSQKRVSALATMASRLNVDPMKLANTLKATCGCDKCTDEQFLSFVVVANAYSLNPLTKEVYAFPAQGKIVPMVGIDGWTHIVNSRPDYDGCEFEFDGDVGDDPKHSDLACTCRIFKKGSAHAVAVTEYLAECARPSQPWRDMPRRMLRHKAFIQCARVAFSLGGIYDPDEARDIAQSEALRVAPPPSVEEAAEVVPYAEATIVETDVRNNEAVTNEAVEEQVIEVVAEPPKRTPKPQKLVPAGNELF